LAGAHGYCNPVFANKIAGWWTKKILRQISCLGLNCPERKSVCCGAGSIAVKRKDYMFACKNCRKEFVGGECKMKFLASQ